MAISDDARAIAAAIITVAAKAGGGSRAELIAYWKETLKELEAELQPATASDDPDKLFDVPEVEERRSLSF